jgi:CheY-like chemotaxis protein
MQESSEHRPGFRALIIDDDLDLLMLLRRTLEFTAGWEVHTASSGTAGLELAGRISPDVVLVDVMMPEMDGYDVCRRLKADPATSKVPVVLLTARREMVEERVASAGAVGVLYKPFQPTELARQIQDLCG